MAGTNLFGPVTPTLDACLTDSSGLIYFGRCTGTPPTTANTFQVGCVLIQTDAVAGQNATFQNVGTSAAPVWTAASSLTKKVTLTTAQLLNLNGTPITVIPGPGTGKVVVVNYASFTMKVTNTPITSANALEIRYTNGSGVKVLSDISSLWLGTASGTSTYVENGLTTNMIAVDNGSIVLVVPSANPTGATGDSTATVTIGYSIVSTS